LKQEIIELVRLSTTKSIRNAGFSFPWISIRAGSLISHKYVCKSTEYTSQLFISLLLWQSFDCEWVEELDLLVAKLVVRLVIGASSQLESLSLGTILELVTDKTVWAGWIVWVGDLRDDQLLW